jgi:hypothetical protein
MGAHHLPSSRRFQQILESPESRQKAFTIGGPALWASCSSAGHIPPCQTSPSWDPRNVGAAAKNPPPSRPERDSHCQRQTTSAARVPPPLGTQVPSSSGKRRPRRTTRGLLRQVEDYVFLYRTSQGSPRDPRIRRPALAEHVQAQMWIGPGHARKSESLQWMGVICTIFNKVERSIAPFKRICKDFFSLFPRLKSREKLRSGALVV